MLARPPEILITTPESLNIVLSTQTGRMMLDGLATVILDEIHAVAATKRGTHLVTAVERLVRLSGEFQRIALSATVRPLSAVADLVGGYRVVLGRAGGIREADGPDRQLPDDQGVRACRLVPCRRSPGRGWRAPCIRAG